MNIKIKSLEKELPTQCCSFCAHLSLDGPDENYKYNIKCVIFNSMPKLNGCCEYFDKEYSNLNTEDLDNLYINYLESCLKINYEKYLKSIHWKLFKEKALDNYNNKCCMCENTNNLNVYHLNKNLGRETFDDVFVCCSNCALK